jgi:hypothetical protein
VERAVVVREIEERPPPRRTHKARFAALRMTGLFFKWSADTKAAAQYSRESGSRAIADEVETHPFERKRVRHP